MNLPDLTPLTKDDEEYILVKVSKGKKKCWVTYLNGKDPETDREFSIETTVIGLLDPELDPEHTDVVPPDHQAPFVHRNREQLNEMIDKRRLELMEKQSQRSRDDSYTRFRNLAASEPGEERPPRELNKSCKTQSPASPDTSLSPLKPRTQ